MLRIFVLFLQLPVELQNIIWQITLSDSRAIGGEECFQEWWHRRLVRFLLPVALYVCHDSRSLAKRILRRTTICIPGLPGWKTFYINQTCDFLRVTKWNIQMNIQVSRFIADPSLINRLVISGVDADTAWFEKDTMHYFDQFSDLEEVVLTDQGRLYQIQKRDLAAVDCYISSIRMSELVQRVQKFFEDEGKNVAVSGYWFNRN
jgi:hypothetical protein